VTLKIRPHLIRVSWLVSLFMMAACQMNPAPRANLYPAEDNLIPAGISEAEALTLASLELVDDYPLYTMIYQGAYKSDESNDTSRLESAKKEGWACSLFAVFGDQENMLFGRNFDWDFSPGLLLFTDPPDGYASVSMVDIAYLGFDGEKAFGLTDLPLEERAGLLGAPLIPFDGMNEAGLAVGMAAVPAGSMAPDPEKDTVDSVRVIRMVLDGAATIEEAVQIIGSVNIDMQGNYLHYLVAERSGRSALVEFSNGEMVVLNNSGSWQPATNFLLSEAGDDPAGQCWRYDLISRELANSGGILSVREAMSLLKDVAQEITQWSVIYQVAESELEIVMGGKFNQVYSFDFVVK
jgi:hypothetical protein